MFHWNAWHDFTHITGMKRGCRQSVQCVTVVQVMLILPDNDEYYIIHLQNYDIAVKTINGKNIYDALIT